MEHTGETKAWNFVLLFEILRNISSSEHFCLISTWLTFSSGIEVPYGDSPAMVQTLNLVVVIPPPPPKLESNVTFITWLQNCVYLKEMPDSFFPNKFIELRSSWFCYFKMPTYQFIFTALGSPIVDRQIISPTPTPERSLPLRMFSDAWFTLPFLLS